MEYIDKTTTGYSVFALMPGEQSPMENHKGGEVAVCKETKRMYVHGVFVATYGTDSIMRAANKYAP